MTRANEEYADAEGRLLDAHEWIGAVVPDDWADDSNNAAEVVDEVRPWLVAHRDEMQRDARAVGRGTMYVAPPPEFGGDSRRHDYFSDLSDVQTNAVRSSSFRLDELATIAHETRLQENRGRHDLYNPWGVVRLASSEL